MDTVFFFFWVNSPLVIFVALYTACTLFNTIYFYLHGRFFLFFFYLNMVFMVSQSQSDLVLNEFDSMQ